MPVICPKCSHVRPADASNPDWQCPACGICYAKFDAQAMPPARPARPARTAGIEVRQGGGLGWVFKLALVIVLVWGLSVAITRRQQPAPVEQLIVAEQHESGPGVAIANAALRISEADASMLHSLSGRLERGCSRNKYGLSEQACIERLREREDMCATKTAQAFPGQIGDTGHMQLIAKAYIRCIFESESDPA